jgi:hypothetical protein
MHKFLPLLIFFLALPAFGRDVYKWTNEEGVVIYSDTYQEGAERVRVSTGAAKTPASRTEGEGAGAGTGASAENIVYQSLEIVQPANDATIRSNEGTVAVGLAISPALGQGHAVKIIVDGTELEGTMQGTQFSLNNLSRGTHSLETRVVDADGNELISSNAINFHLRQTSIIKP